LLTFKNATINDITEILAIEQRSFDVPWSQGSLAGEFSDPLSTIIIARSSCQNITYGYSCYRVISPEAELLRIAVSPELRRLGIGRSLLDECLRRLQLLQIKTLHLEVSESNREAMNLYEKTGFFVSGRRLGYYDNGATAALLLQRNF
jgi:ribosomal-protein-alanine N-acetyltransferase